MSLLLQKIKIIFYANLQKEKGFTFVPHRTNIGGRYSISSEAGMLPAYLMGLNLNNLKKNLRKFLNNKKILSNSRKEILNFKNNKFKILIFFNYIPELNDFLFWLQQLLAESLGKIKKVFYQLFHQHQKIIIVYYNYI